MDQMVANADTGPLPSLTIGVECPPNMQEARARFLRGFAGEYFPIYYRASVSPQSDVGAFVFMLVKQGGTSGRVSSNMRQFPSTDGSNTLSNPEFFVYGSQPQPIPNKVPVGSPIVQVTIEVRTLNMLVTGTVKVVAARSITSLRMSDPAAVWVLDAAGWAAAAVEATGLSIEQGRLPRARMSFKQDFRDLRDFRNKTPTPVPHEQLTHEQLGSRTVLRLAVVSTGAGPCSMAQQESSRSWESTRPSPSIPKAWPFPCI